MSQGRSPSVFLAAAVIAMTGAASAQTNSEVNAGIQFNFSEPGARSLSMGGAFIGLADDATAAYTNAAGLTTLSLPEVSVEARTWGFTHVFTDRGRLEGSQTGNGVDTETGLRNGEAENDVAGLSFLSVVYPRKRWVWALYRHELAHFEADFQAQGAFLTDDSRLLPTDNRLRLEIINLGLSAAYRVSESLSLGLGISRYDFSFDSQTLRFNPFPGSFYGPPVYEDERVLVRQSQEGQDADFGVNVGFNWQMSPSWQLGAVYRKGPQFRFVTDDRFLPVRPEDQEKAATRRVAFKTPDVLGLGFARQPTELSTFTLDIVRVEYSDLMTTFGIAFGNEEPGVADGRLLVDDVYEIHVGIEHFFSSSKQPLALRAGAWLDPDHRFRYEGPEQAFQALCRRGEDEIHYAAGLGVVFPKFQMDAALDLSDRVITASLSTVARF